MAINMAKVLICDDEPGLRTVIKRYAQFEGHEVREARDGAEAVEICGHESFDNGAKAGFIIAYQNFCHINRHARQRTNSH